MALLTTTALLGFATGGLYYSKVRRKKNDPYKAETSYLSRIKSRLTPIKTHRQSMQKFLEDSPDQQSHADEKAKTEALQSKKTLTVFTGSTVIAVTGTLLYPPLAILSIPGALYLLQDVYKNTAQVIIKREHKGVDPLMAIFITAMLYQGHFVASHFFISLYLLNRHLVKRIKQESQKNIIDVFRDQPDTAWVLIDGVEIELPVEDIQEDAVVVVKAGEAIPVDGSVLSGYAAVDQHILTGESQPVEKNIGDTVLACTVVLTGSIQIKVEKTGAATASARIGEILNNTVEYKTKRQLWAERFTEQTVLPTLGLSALTLAVAGPTTALVVINSHFRYRLTLATSTSALTFLNLAAQKGILMKSGLVLEQLQEVDTVVFDKTGTLTLETPQVVNVITFGEYDADVVLCLAASVESRQSHPVAKAICHKANELGLKTTASSEASYQVGYGLVASIEAQKIQVGSLRYAEQQGFDIPPELAEKAGHCHQQGHSLIIVSINNVIAGAIELQATIRPEAASVIRQLHDLGMSLHIISGDHPAPTKSLAEKLDIDNYHAEVLPESKAEIIKQLQDQGHSVCYIGDGINDAIALKEADVSVSLRGASSVATDTAEVILMDQNLTHLCDLFSLATEYEQNVRTTSQMILVPSLMNLGLAFVPGYGIAASIGMSAGSVLAGFGSSMWPLIRHEQQMRLNPPNPPPISAPRSDQPEETDTRL